MRAGLATLAKRLMLSAVLVGPACGAAAHGLTLRECLEGGDFIKHAAMSRDNGITREVFLERMDGDLLAIRQYPPHLRWFVQDQEDEALLVQAARRVFDSPRDPPSHQSEFLARCMERIGRGSGAGNEIADREFVSSFATRIIEMKPGASCGQAAVVEYRRSYDDYLASQGLA